MRDGGLMDVAGGVRNGTGSRVAMRHNRDAARRSGEREGVFGVPEGWGITLPRLPKGVLRVARAELALEQRPVIPGVAILVAGLFGLLEQQQSIRQIVASGRGGDQFQRADHQIRGNGAPLLRVAGGCQRQYYSPQSQLLFPFLGAVLAAGADSCL